MSDEKEVYNWDEVMGSNMVYPTPSMAYRPYVVTRKTRLKREGRTASVRPMKVSYDVYFIVWRLANVLKGFKAIDESKLREVFELVLHEIINRKNDEIL